MAKKKTCTTCVYVTVLCGIFKAACEHQMQKIQPEDFGCNLHLTQKQYNKVVDAMCGKADDRP